MHLHYTIHFIKSHVRQYYQQTDQLKYTEALHMEDQSEILSRHFQPTHYLSQSRLVGRLLPFSVA
jgi:hypothetical protein